MAAIQPLYGANNQPISCTLTGLNPSFTAGRCSAAIDNTSTLFLDALVFLKSVKTITGTLSSSKTIYLWVYASVDGGTTYTDSMPGTDSGLSRTDPPLLRYLGAVPILVAGIAYSGGPFSVAAAFGGVLPDHWGVFVNDDTSLRLDTVNGGSLIYQGVAAQSS